MKIKAEKVLPMAEPARMNETVQRWTVEYKRLRFIELEAIRARAIHEYELMKWACDHQQYDLLQLNTRLIRKITGVEV